MKKTLIATLAATALLAGCAAPGYGPYGYYDGGAQYASAPQYAAPQPQYSPQYAPRYVPQPQYASAPPPAPTPVAYAGGPVPSNCTGELNGGHIIGGIAGALIGAQVGKGNGRTAAAAVGAATGALVGGNLSCR